MTEPKIILDQDGIRRALTRIAFEIVEKNKGAEHLLLAGVKTRGIYLAQRIADKLGEVGLPFSLIFSTKVWIDIRFFLSQVRCCFTDCELVCLHCLRRPLRSGGQKRVHHAR